MAVQIDRLDAAVEISPSQTPTQPEVARARTDDPVNAATFKESVLQVLSEAFDQFTRMRGH
jgi:hypothetical protein